MQHRGKLLLSVVVTVAAYLIWVVLADWRAVVLSLQRIGWLGLGLILSLSLVNYGIRFARWDWLLYRMGYKVPLLASLQYYLAGFALTTTPGKAGEAIRSVFLKRHNVPYSNSLAALFGERFADTLSVTVIAMLGIVAIPELQWVAIVFSIACLSMLAILRSQPARDVCSGAVARLLPGRFAILSEKFDEFLDHAGDLVGHRVLLLGFLLGLIAWGAEAFAFAFIVHSLGYELPTTVLAAVYAASMLAGALSFLPGGLGGAEVAMGVMLAGLGLAAPDVVSATVLCRVATLWFAVAIGLASLATISADSRTDFASDDGNLKR